MINTNEQVLNIEDNSHRAWTVQLLFFWRQAWISQSPFYIFEKKLYKLEFGVPLKKIYFVHGCSLSPRRQMITFQKIVNQNKRPKEKNLILTRDIWTLVDKQRLGCRRRNCPRSTSRSPRRTLEEDNTANTDRQVMMSTKKTKVRTITIKEVNTGRQQQKQKMSAKKMRTKPLIRITLTIQMVS